jgi:ATP-dependent DNA ligase
MPKFEFCLPTTSKAVPSGEDWFHEIKFDGYRLRIAGGKE